MAARAAILNKHSLPFVVIIAPSGASLHRFRSLFRRRIQTKIHSVPYVLRVTQVLKIVRSIIAFIPVNVIHLFTFGAWTVKRRRNNLVNKKAAGLTVLIKNHTKVFKGFCWCYRAQDTTDPRSLAGTNSPDSPVVRCFVPSLVSEHGPPLLTRNWIDAGWGFCGGIALQVVARATVRVNPEGTRSTGRELCNRPWLLTDAANLLLYRIIHDAFSLIESKMARGASGVDCTFAPCSILT